MSPFSLSRVKDAALESLILSYLRPKVERYGEIVEFNLDTSNKNVSGLLRLQGEPTPLRISRASYRVADEGGDCMLVISDIRVDRLWLQHVVDDHFPEIRITLPPAIRPLAERL